ncbi:hypothetical protein [Streptomyces rubellomurinus]|uniref:hypothetical protein n=1 Tax=Streptomyces rubellomurinus (strain ATCC 31215) TaxID=359131 RepID=UPI00069803BA|nr:hypothetical protein [Streptomyces rubellomurinus]
MLPRTVRGAVAVAAVVVEEVGKRVVGTAAAVLEKTGVDVAEVERRLGGQFPPSAEKLQALAGEALTAGRAGVDLAVGVARGEVEKVFEKVGDQVTKVGVVLAYLENKLSDLEGEQAPEAGPEPDANAYADLYADPYASRYAAEGADMEPAPAPRADELFGRGWERDADEWAEQQVPAEPIAAERVEVDEPVEVDPPVAPVKRAPVKKALAKKAAVKKAAVKKAAAKKTAAKKTAASTTTARTTAAAKKTAAQQAATAKKTTTKKTTVRKATSRKQPDVRDE